jgi:hypothetical protein
MNAPVVQLDDPTKLNWWTAALKGERRAITEDPMTGYYRARRKNKQTGEERLYAVAYWWHNGKCFCKVDGGPTLQGEPLQRMIEAWPHVSKEPIKYDVYQAVIAGKPWPDQHVDEKAAPAETSANQPLPQAAETSKPPVAGAAEQSRLKAGTQIAEGNLVGDPEPLDESPQGILKREIERAKGGVSRYVSVEPGKAALYKIDSDEMLAAAQELRSKLLTLANRAKKAREEANRPLNEKIRENGKIWSPLEDEAQRHANWLRDGPMKAWEQHKRDQQAAAAKAAAAAAGVEGKPVQPVSNAPAPSAKIKGATGKAASVSTVKVAVIEDQDKVYQFFRDNEQLKAILQGLANGSVRAGIEVPGTSVKEEVSIK